MAEKENFMTQFRHEHNLHSVDFMRVWTHYDKDKSGFLEPDEVEKFIPDLLSYQGNEITPEQLKRYNKLIMENFDKNKDGKISLEELAKLLPVEDNFMIELAGKSKLSRGDMKKIFDHYDKDKSGSIGGAELLAVIKDIFEHDKDAISANELKDYAKIMLECFDSSGKGKLSFDEMALLLTA